MHNFFSKRGKEKGFTLIELLVVIAIIGTLATIVLVSLNTARQKARDTRRVSDMRQVALGLEMYYDSNDAYPGDADAVDCDDWATMESALETGGQITSVPSDPGANTYVYEDDATHQDYVLGAVLEDSTNSALDDDVDTDTNGCSCDQATEYCIVP